MSELALTTMGVPQGPLDSLYIADFPRSRWNVHCYADDVRCVLIDLNVLITEMYSNLETINKWSHANKLQLNFRKTKILFKEMFR